MALAVYSNLHHTVAVTAMALGWAALTATASAQTRPDGVAVDGRFSEWDVVPVLIDDPADAPPSAAVDIGRVYVVDDPAWIYLAIGVDRIVNAQAMRGVLKLVLDTDGDVRTGGSVHGMHGVDAVVELSRQDTPRPDGYGAGIGIRTVTARGDAVLHPGYDARILVAPTHSANRFELRMSRQHLPTGTPALSGEAMRIRLVFVGPEGLDETAIARHVFASAMGATRDNRATGVPPVPAGAFRVVQWNVAENGIRERPARFRRVLAALDPTVVLLDEVYGAATAQEMEAFFAGPPLGNGDPWHVVLGRSGGRQKTVVAGRGSVRPAVPLLDVRYPDGAMDRLEAAVSDTAFARLFSLERRRGVPSAGAWVTLGSREVLFVPVDLQSAGYHNSPGDRLRVLQARTVRDRVGEVLASAPGNPPVVIGGDLNLVGSVAPLDALVRRLDGPVDLAVAQPFRLTDRTQVTWRSVRRIAFTPGRLDYMVYSGSSLEPVRAFVFDTTELTVDAARAVGLEPDDSNMTSDHLPLVVDFTWRR